MQWPDSFYELRRGEGCPMCEQGRPWPFPFPDEEPGEIDESEFRADVGALRT